MTKKDNAAITFWATLVADAFFAAIIAAYLGLLPLGYWADEYFLFAQWKEGGTSYLDRVLHWSPRPVSEGMVYVYMRLADSLHRPLITPALLFFWGLLIASALITARNSGVTLSTRILMALSVIAMFLVGHPLGNMFYWPLGAVAYVPTLAGITFLLFQAFDTVLITPTHIAVRSIVLVLVATCSEVGAIFAFTYAAYLGVMQFIGIFFPNPSGSSAVRQLRWQWRLMSWLVPLLLSVGIFLLMFLNRVMQTEEVMLASRYIHHLGSSLYGAIPRFLADFGSMGGESLSRRAIVKAVLIKLFFFLGFLGCCSRIYWPTLHRRAYFLLGFSIACWNTAFLSIAAAYYQFGMLCCERHETLRQCLYILSLAALAGCCAIVWRNIFPHRPTFFTIPWLKAIVPPLLLMAAAAICLTTSGRWLRADYLSYHKLYQARMSIWSSGLQPDKTTAVFVQTMPGSIVGGRATVPAAIYTLAEDPHWYIKGVMMYFHKRAVMMLPPE